MKHTPIDLRRIEVVDDDMAAVLRSKTGAERLAIAFEMFESARRMLSHHLTTEHPEWTPEEVQREVARRISRGEIGPPLEAPD